jgi:hypothetical protein
MGRTQIFSEFTDKTKSMWETRANVCAEIARREGGFDYQWTKDEILNHLETVLDQQGEEYCDKLKNTYFERMRMASVYNGTAKPTLDLVYTQGNGCAYVWLYESELPSGFIGHILSVAGGLPRLAFDYFFMMSKEYSIDDLVNAIGTEKAMTLLLFAELFARVHKAGDFTPDQFDFYIGHINALKSDIQSKITPEQAEQFNEMMGALLLTAGD